MAATGERAKYGLRRLWNFFKIFFRSKQGILGLAIIFFFVVMAVGAPLLTPYDPLQQGLSGDYAAPTWNKYLPAVLGGDPKLSENFRATNNTDFSQGIGGWKLTSDSPLISNLQLETGLGSSNHSLKLSFERDAGVLTGESNASIYFDFHYPFAGLPDRFLASMEFSVNGTFYNITSFQLVYNYTNGGWDTLPLIRQSLVVVPQIHLFLQRLSDGKKWYIWPTPDVVLSLGTGKLAYGTQAWLNAANITLSTQGWERANLDSNSLYAAKFPGVYPGSTSGYGVVSQTFQNIPGNFRYGMDVSFLDTLNSTIPAETTVYIDYGRFFTYGKSWGLLGTDQLGRDLWSQLVYGSRISLIIGILAAAIGVVLGLAIGLASGFLGSAVDEVLMRFTDLLLVIPFLPLMMVLVQILGRGIENLIVIIGFLGWMGFARVIRSQVLTLKERPFIEAAKSVGAGRIHIIVRHILPNVMSLVYVTLASSVPGAITLEASLAFLGFYDPTRMSWGRMLNGAFFSGTGSLFWWWVIIPGLCIALLAMAFILLGFALDEIMNPRLRLRR